MKYDLAFLMCCCKSFLGSDDDDEIDTNNNNNDSNNNSNNNVNGTTSNNYYNLLQIPRDSTVDEIKRAYKKQSLAMHPDKLAQRGLQVTADDQARFTKMKEAYEVLSDPSKRELYDAIGARGMRWLEEPFSIDPQELAHNFAKSSILDRSKIFAIFVCIAVALLLQPILICMHIDGSLGTNASWVATLIPLWLWNIILIIYHTRVIMMGPIPKPDHIPDNEWIDPLPMNKRIFSMSRFLLIVLFELLVAFKLDHVIKAPWFVLFLPFYCWEATTLYKKLPLARMRIVTVEDLESALGKSFNEFTAAEKELIGQRYSVVSSTSSPDFDAAQKLKTRARHDIVKSIFRIVFVIVLLVQLDGNQDWNWWLVFSPFWIMTFLICYANYLAFAEVQKVAAEKDPTLFGNTTTTTKQQQQQNDVESSGVGDKASSSYYGSLGDNGFFFGTGAATSTKVDGTTASSSPDQQSSTNADGSTKQQQQTPVSPLTEEEREELKAQVMASSSRLCSKCCFQGFILFIFFLFVAKLQGAGFSAFLIISPFLLIAGLILCCLGCAIFGVTEVPTDGIDFENSHFDYTNVEQGGGLKPSNAPSGTTTTATGLGAATDDVKAKTTNLSSQSSPIIIVPEPSSQTVGTTTTSTPKINTTSDSRKVVTTEVISSGGRNAPTQVSVFEGSSSVEKESSSSYPSNQLDSINNNTNSSMKSSFRGYDSGDIAGAVLDLD